MIDRKIEPLIKDAVEFDLKLPACNQYHLKNGVPVYEVNTGPQEVAQVEFVFYAGNWFENKKLVAAATSSLLKNGTVSKTAFELNEAFEYFGAFCNCSSQHETATIKLNSLSKDLDSILPLIAEMLTESTFPQEELNTWKQNNKQRLTVNLQKSDFVASRLIDTYLYGEAHPYGTYSTAADIDALQAEELRAFYKDFYTHGHCIIFVSGKFNIDIQNMLNRYFGYLPLKAPVPLKKTFLLNEAVEKKYRVVNDEKGVQGAIRLARPFVGRMHPDFTKAMLLNTLFGGYFGSRLMSNIREDKGYTYGIHSYVQSHFHETSWMISTDAGKEVSEATIEETYKEMRLLCTEKIDEEELNLVRNYMLGSVLGSLDGPFQIIARWKSIVLNGLDENYFYKSINDVKYTSAEELQELSKKYLVPEDFYELVVY